MTELQIPTVPIPALKVPGVFGRLRDIAYNLWWTWSPLAHSLFYKIDPVRWVHYRSPIQLLINLEPERWLELQNNTEFIRAYRTLVERFDQYMTLLHRSADAPMVLRTLGYTHSLEDRKAELTLMLNSNQLVVEHRFFDTSTPASGDGSRSATRLATTSHTTTTAAAPAGRARAHRRR